MKYQIMEVTSMEDLLKVSRNFIFKMSFGSIHIYYSGVTGGEFVGLNVFVTEHDYIGELQLSSQGKIEKIKEMSPHSYSVIFVSDDTLLRPILANYIVNKFGYSKKIMDQTASVLTRLISDKMSAESNDRNTKV